MQDKHYLDDWIHVPICQKGDKLYHYTTAEGIRGIVENREFVATKSDFLNDKMEFQYAVEVMEQLIERYIVNTDLRMQFSAKLKAEIDRIGIISSAHAALDEDEMSFYVVAFSKQNNNSLLWAEFTDFRGYCLEFDYEKIVEGFRHRVFLHGTVIYDEEEQMNGLLESLLSCIHSLVEKGSKGFAGLFRGGRNSFGGIAESAGRCNGGGLLCVYNVFQKKLFCRGGGISVHFSAAAL